jgi:hypothetical protein
MARSDLQPRAFEQNITGRDYSRNKKKKIEMNWTFAMEGKRSGNKGCTGLK